MIRMTGKRTNHHGHSLDPVPCRCGECGKSAELVTGDVIYPHRPDLAGKRFYKCSCGAYVGTHPGTCEPLGTPANTETRKARSEDHAHFDALYKEVERRKPTKESARKRGYRWLAERMEMTSDECHIGMMNAAQARRVTAICRPHMAKLGIFPERRR